MRLSLSTFLPAVAALLFAAAALRAQSAPQTPSAPANAQPCTASPQPAPCSVAPAEPSTKGSADRFPFPGEAPAAPEAPKTVSPDAPSSPAPLDSSGKNFPFPGEAPAPASSSSTDPTAFPGDDASTPDSNAPDASGKAKAAAPEGRRLLKRVNPIGTKLQSNDEREAEDLNVARFYTQTGNLQGAYLRAQDAVKIMPNDPDAHCSLADAALKVNKREEAIAEFNACLKLDPDEKEAKSARKELAKLK